MHFPRQIHGSTSTDPQHHRSKGDGRDDIPLVSKVLISAGRLMFLMMLGTLYF